MSQSHIGITKHSSITVFQQFIQILRSSCLDHAFKSPRNSLDSSSFSYTICFVVAGVALLSACVSAKRTSPFKSAGASVQSTTDSRGVRISGSHAGYTMFRGSVKSIGYPLHSPVSPSLPLPCVTVCNHVSTGLYNRINTLFIRRNTPSPNCL